MHVLYQDVVDVYMFYVKRWLMYMLYQELVDIFFMSSVGFMLRVG